MSANDTFGYRGSALKRLNGVLVYVSVDHLDLALVTFWSHTSPVSVIFHGIHDTRK